MSTFRDLFLNKIQEAMYVNEDIYFLTADFGAPALDQLKADFPQRCINVGVAEQNLINTSVGLAKEGATVFCFAIAPFITMRCLEQIRTCVSVFSRYQPLNINIIGVGAGVSYDMAGPTHHCFEDLSVMNMLPRVDVFSPSDGTLIDGAFAHSMSVAEPLYLRFDSKPLPNIDSFTGGLKFSDGYRLLKSKYENDTVLIATGFATNVAHQAYKNLSGKVDLVDVFCFGQRYKNGLRQSLAKYKNVYCLCEGFRWSGGLDTYVLESLDIGSISKFESFGFDDYCFELGQREILWANAGLSVNAIVDKINLSIGR
jgi:transketolase